MGRPLKQQVPRMISLKLEDLEQSMKKTHDKPCNSVEIISTKTVVSRNNLKYEVHQYMKEDSIDNRLNLKETQ